MMYLGTYMIIHKTLLIRSIGGVETVSVADLTVFMLIFVDLDKSFQLFLPYARIS